MELQMSEHEQNQDNRLASLEERVAQLETSLLQANDTIIGLQRTIVEITADHVNRIFNDQVLLDSIAQRVLVAGANAISFKAKASRQQAPELMVVEGYLKGAIRVTLNDEGVLVEMEDNPGSGNWVTGEELPEGMRSPEVAHVFGDLLISYGAEVGKAYFIMEKGDIEAARAEANKAALALTGLGESSEEQPAPETTH
jgi:uncharacterized coiled-coil protein SlyX